MVLFFLVRRFSAKSLGLYFNSLAHCCTFSMVALLMSGWFFKARDTVEGDMFSALAMSIIVACGLFMAAKKVFF